MGKCSRRLLWMNLLSNTALTMLKMSLYDACGLARWWEEPRGELTRRTLTRPVKVGDRIYSASRMSATFQRVEKNKPESKNTIHSL